MKDLFGDVPEPARDDAPVSLSLIVVGTPSAAAWPLSDGRPGSPVRWVPKSRVRRGEGRDENLWTMPRWMARERGWL